MVISLQRGADLHMAQLMPLPLTVSCFSKIQIGFTFLVPAHPGSPRQRVIKRMCMCVCRFLYVLVQCVSSFLGHLYVLFEPFCPVDTVLLFTVFTVLYLS